jgi:prepilin-type N-terminal cleavage/methylation domain-containing protein
MTRRSDRSESGFTLVEVMVAMSILLIGVLGTVTMIDGANAGTSRTKAREGGTALARSVLEIARAVPYRELTAARVLTELDGHSGLADAKPGQSGHQIVTRGFTYTVTPTACAMDDPKDNLGSHDESAVTFCADTDALGVGATASDRNPDDYRRVGISLSWSPDVSHTDSVKQTGIVANPVGGLGPSVTELDPKTPATTTITTNVSAASYDLTTSSIPSEVSWSINGQRLGQASGSGTAWTFSWDLGPTDAPKFVDCAYVVQAEAFDDKGRGGAAKALTVTLNRRAPFAPVDFAGGRNLNGARVDVQWSPNQECDVKKYAVYRGTSSGAINTLVCAPLAGAPTECVDETAPAHTTLYYQVVAVDTPPTGGDREGTRSAILTVGDEDANQPPPTAPTNLTVCTGGNPGCNDIDGEPAPPGSPVLAWDPGSDPDGIAFYRIYRDGNTYGDRLSILYADPSKPLVFIDATASGAHGYRVSAVDPFFGESALTDPVAWQ